MCRKNFFRTLMCLMLPSGFATMAAGAPWNAHTVQQLNGTLRR
jgi:hypothetical protein